ncbi:MAG: MauE/DoxX family redox-associated membrane protein, partial [Acidimicrobiales bacterium]
CAGRDCAGRDCAGRDRAGRDYGPSTRMTPLAAGPFIAAAGLLGAGGVAKVAMPTDTARALVALASRRARPAADPRWARGLVRLVGAGEVVLAGGVLAVGGQLLSGLVAVSYLGFAAVVGVALVRRLPLSSCGCLGPVETPPGPWHVVLNLGAFAAGAWEAAGPAPSLVTVVGSRPLTGAALLVLAAVTVGLAAAVLSSWPGRGPAGAHAWASRR